MTPEPSPSVSGSTRVPAWVGVISAPAVLLMVVSALSPLWTDDDGPRPLDVADVEGVWTEEGGGRRLTPRADGTGELAEAATGEPAGSLSRGTWRFGDPDDPRVVAFDFSPFNGMDVDESGERSRLFAGGSSTEYVRTPR
ncbi:hypothetical protein [Streptomyces sp. NPDC085529]|uniref:hypothetical protein n=1 Tax=Streptomyces sp. NPDC085529 TaxID=3365729 RepID=UPI0037D2416C